MPRPGALPVVWRPLPLLLLWIAAGAALSAVAGRARDWFDMTDELRYERLAISIARTHSIVPRIHGVEVKSFSQLYPLLIAPIFAHGFVPHDLVQAHVLNAWVMSSACIPAYLLARHVTGRRGPAYAVAALSAFMPWIVYSAMLMTEVAAYPSFVWALLALSYATARPSARGDLAALAGLALAFFARTELLALVAVLPVAIVAFELGRAQGATAGRRIARALRSSVARHRALAASYAVLVAGAIVLEALGDVRDVVGVYGTNAHAGGLVSTALVRPFAAHVALFSLGFGVLPFLVGAAWLLANLVRPHGSAERHAFACVAAVTALILFLDATNFDVRYAGGPQIQDRYLLYLVPPVLVAVWCALDDLRRPRWSLLAPAIVTIAGFAVGEFPAWQRSATLATDSPMSGFLRRIVNLTSTLAAARVALVVATIALALVFAAGTIWVRRTALTVATAAFALVALPAITVATFAQLFGAPGWSGRPLTASQAGVLDWADRAIGPRGRATIVPYLVSSDYFVSEQTFRDLEFWNKSVVRDVLDPGGDAYAYTGNWFPKIDLSIDRQSGRGSASPTRWAIMSDKDTRFALAGEVTARVGDLELVRVAEPWRAEWMSLGLYDDGWTRPGVTARIRIFPRHGQQRGEIRRFAFGVRAADGAGSQPVRIDSNIDGWKATVGGATMTDSIAVCVPPRGYTEIRIAGPGSVAIPPDASTQGAPPRRGGVFFGETALAGEIGGRCRAGRAKGGG